MIPESIQIQALAAHSDSAPLEYRRSAAKAGEIAVASRVLISRENRDLRRLVAILERREATGTVEILLVSNEIENATDLDLIVGTDDSGLPFDIMVQSELYGPLFVEQIQSKLGSIKEGERFAVAAAMATDGESLDEYQVGLPLGGFSDPRREFKAHELVDLEALVSDCRHWLAGGAANVRLLDPELLLPPPTGTSIDEAADQFLELLDVLDAMGERTVLMPETLFSSLLHDAELLDELVRWRVDFGFDASSLVARIQIVEEGLETTQQEGNAMTDRRTQRAITEYARVQADCGVYTLDVHSGRRWWPQVPAMEVVYGTSGNACRTRVQIMDAA